VKYLKKNQFFLIEIEFLTGNKRLKLGQTGKQESIKPLVRLNSEKEGKPLLWFSPNQKKEVNHTVGLVQIGKRRSTTALVLSKSKKRGKPLVWSGPNQKKEVNHTYGLVQKAKRRQTIGVDGSKLEN